MPHDEKTAADVRVAIGSSSGLAHCKPFAPRRSQAVPLRARRWRAVSDEGAREGRSRNPECCRDGIHPNTLRYPLCCKGLSRSAKASARNSRVLTSVAFRQTAGSRLSSRRHGRAPHAGPAARRRRVESAMAARDTSHSIASRAVDADDHAGDPTVRGDPVCARRTSALAG